MLYFRLTVANICKIFFYHLHIICKKKQLNSLVAIQIYKINFKKSKKIIILNMI